MAVLGCRAVNLPETAGKQKAALIAAQDDASALCCWYVISDESGSSGYAMADGRLGYLPAGGGGLFKSLGALKSEMKARKFGNVTIVGEFGGKVPNGWSIRGLTKEEWLELARGSE